MVTKEEMKSQLSGVGIQASDEILELCCDYCLRNNTEEANFVDEWVAFAFNELSSNLNITKEGLQFMERKKKDSKVFTTPKQGGRNLSKIAANREITPKRNNLLQHHVNSSSEGLTFSPTSYSPTVNKEQRESNIPSGQVLLTCGKSSNNWKSSHVHHAEVKLNNSVESNCWKYMHDVLYDIWNLSEDFSEEIAERLVKLNELTEAVPFYLSSGESSVFIGRVTAEEARINSQNVEMQGIGPSCQEKVEVDMSQLPDFSLFPGQVVAFKGFREGKKLIATQLYISAKGPAPETPIVKDVLQFVIAAGPFAGPDQLSGDIFSSVIKYLQEHKPHFFFLIGPLIDSTNQQVNMSDFAETFVNYYHRVLSQISNSLTGLPTKFFFISSPKDVVNLPIYPTPPLSFSNSFQNALKFLPDPSLLNINGLVVGFTSVDSLFHLSKKEVSNCKGNRLARLAGHLINQQTFYPLFPSDLDVGIDLKLWYKCARIPTVPHILVLPSDLHFFVKCVEDCLVINPERIVKGYTRGSFAHVEVNPQSEESSWNVNSHISVRIIKV